MIVLRLLRAWVGRAYYEWAAREIDPMSPDVFHVLTRRNHYAQQLKGILK